MMQDTQSCDHGHAKPDRCTRTIRKIKTCDKSSPAQGVNMFEYDQDIVDTLLQENENFKRMYEKHGELKQRVRDANVGAERLDDFALENMKKEKLMLKDRMSAMIQEYRRAHV